MTSIFGKNPVVRALLGVALIAAGLALGKPLLAVIGGGIAVVAGVQAVAGGLGRGVIGGKGDGRSLR